MTGHHFISYSSADAEEFALKLADELSGGRPSFPVWIDKRELQAGEDWDEQIVEAIRTCDSLIFVMSEDSVEDQSVCKQEWTRALKYKKLIIPLRLDSDAELPFRLGSRQSIDFTGSFDTGLARLRRRLQELGSPRGALQALEDRLVDAERDLRRANEDSRRSRIQGEIQELKQQIEQQQRVVADPQKVAKRVEHEIKQGLERERLPAQQATQVTRGKFVNTPPVVAPSYFQGRQSETKQIGQFLQDDASRLLTIVGRGGIGKTTLVCRLLKALENGHLPDSDEPLEVDGIVYLSSIGSRQVNVPNLYTDLSRLLPGEIVAQLDAFYKNPRISTEAKMGELLQHFSNGTVVLLLDNFEDIIEPETQKIRDTELDEALRAILNLPQHAVKVIITTRITPRDVALLQPGRQALLNLDEGLPSPHAENLLRQKDMDGKVGLRDASDDLLSKARERTLGYPRALEALFAILAADRDTSLADIVNDTSKLLPDNVIEALVGEAFSRLDATAQSVMQALAVYNRPVTHNAVDYLLQPYNPSIKSAQVLGRLVNMQFARKQGDRYYLHPVDRAYSFERIPQGAPADRDQPQPPFTQFALLHRGAEYFNQTHLLSKNIKSLVNIAPQLAEYELHYAGQNYDEAGEVLLNLLHYFWLWGLFHMQADLCRQLLIKIKSPLVDRKIMLALGRALGYLGEYSQAITYINNALENSRQDKDRQSEANSLWRLGFIYFELGRVKTALECYKQAFVIALEKKDRDLQGHVLGSVAMCYSELGDIERAIDYHRQSIAVAKRSRSLANVSVGTGNLGLRYGDLGENDQAATMHREALAIALKLGARSEEGRHLVNQAIVLIDQGQHDEAIEKAAESAKIANEISSPRLGSYSNRFLALARLYTEDLHGARSAAELARMHNSPEHHHSILALLGVIALRQHDLPAARAAFEQAVVESNTLLAHTPQLYNSLDSKALALSGLALIEGAQHVPEAIETYTAARNITKAAGIVARVLRLHDALAVMDEQNILQDVRVAAAGE